MSAAAARDMDAIVEYSRQTFGSRQAAWMASEIRSRMHKTLARFPSAGRLRPETGPGIRSFPVRPYVVFYRAARGRIEVLRIIHQQRDLSAPLMSLLVA